MLKTDLKYSLLISRFKAQVIDVFMIYAPILYITTYLILGGASDFRSNNIAIFICIILYATISALFIKVSSQTPGKRAYSIKLVMENGGKVGFFRAFFRFILYLFFTENAVGIFVPFYRKDGMMLHDLLNKIKVIFQEQYTGDKNG